MTKLLSGAACGLVLCAAVASAAAQNGAENLIGVDVSASSTLKPKKDQYAPWRALDFDFKWDETGDISYNTTGWCEGKKDQGVGEYLEISGQGLTFSSLSIHAGYWKNAKLFKANNRPTRLTIVVTDVEGNQQTKDVAVPAGMEATEVDFGGTVEAASVRIVFAEVAKGKLNDTCISHVGLRKNDAILRPVLAYGAAIQDLQGAIETLNQGLEKCDAAILGSAIKYPMAYKSLPDPMGEVKQIKTKYKKAKDLLKACAKGNAPFPANSDYDLGTVYVEGAGKIRFFTGANNEYGGVTWHLVYLPASDGGPGQWKLTAVDY